MPDTRPALVFDRELILKYDKPGPRYTSYPTAPHFHENFQRQEYIEEIQRTNSIHQPPPISLYIHLPFCQSVCYFCGCNVHFTKDRSLGTRYVERLLAEMKALSPMLHPQRQVIQIHWGGGTPTFISASVLERLFNGIQEYFNIADNAEIGVEIDPREVQPEHFDLFAQCGFNRISMGIQDFDPKVQEAVHRIQPEKLTRSVIRRCRELGLESINIDLMYGLPHQTAESFQRTVDRIIDMDPDRIAVFNFAYLPQMIKHQRALPKEALPVPMEKLAILEMVVRRFQEAGYLFIGMDHFSRPDDELNRALEKRTLYRNFQGYTTQAGCDLYGIGVTSIGQVGRCYVQNLKKTAAYEAAIDQHGLAVFRGVQLTDDDLLRRDVITRLMCHFVLYKKEIEDLHGIHFDKTFAGAMEGLRPMEEDGLVSLYSDRIEVQPLGRLLVRNIAMHFDAYLGRSAGKARFSRTV